MAKIKAKIKSKAGRIRNPKKSLRWAKGDSCISNPQKRKYRDEASSLYFHQNIKNPLLTPKNVQNLGNNGPTIDEDVLSADVESLSMTDGLSAIGSFSTHKSFASDWSKCSNAAFEKFLNRFKIDSHLHKEMLSILAATTEVINSMGGTHRETEYFASFMTTLGECDESQYGPMMGLLSIVTSRVPQPILRKTFPGLISKLGPILTHALDNSDSHLIRLTLGVLKKILGVQDPSIFSNPTVTSLTYSILRSALSPNPKVRRKARLAVGFVLSRERENSRALGPFLKIVLGWAGEQLASFPTGGTRNGADVLGLLQFVWSGVEIGGLPTGVPLKKLYESILRVMSSGEASVVKAGFSFFITSFSTQAKNELSPKLLGALWEFKPDSRNGDTYLLYLETICSALRVCDDQNSQEGSDKSANFIFNYLPLLLEEVSSTWSSNFGFKSSKVLINHFPFLINESTSIETVEKISSILSKNLLSLPLNANAMSVLGAFVDCLNAEQWTLSCREILLQLLPLKTTSGVGGILGKFVKNFGLENLWESLDDLNEKISSLLPLVRDNLHGGKLSFWKSELLPLLYEPNRKIDDKILLFESLVGFCRDPADANEFPAEIVGKTIENRPTFRLSALCALRQFCSWPSSESILIKFAPNFMPLLFNLFIGEKNEIGKNKDEAESHMGQADALGTTIKNYLNLCTSQYRQDLVLRTISKFEEGSEEERGPVLDLMTFLAIFFYDPCTDSKLLQIATQLISDKKQMKKAYRLILALLTKTNGANNDGEMVGKIVQILRESKGGAKSNAQSIRLQCINVIIHKNDEWLSEFLPEAILSLLSFNTKARQTATSFIQTLCQNIKESKLSRESVDKTIILGLESPNLFIKSSTFHFLNIIYKKCPHDSPVEELIKMGIEVLSGDSAKLKGSKIDKNSLSREALEFLSLNVSVFKGRIGPWAPTFGNIIATGELPRRESTKFLARLLKAFGLPGVKAILPEGAVEQMGVRLKNLERKLRKLKEKKRKIKEGGDGETFEKVGDESEEDESGDDDNFKSNKKMSKNNKMVIKEGLVDFLSPQAMTSALINKPKEKKEDSFKYSKDGKLIIAPSSSDSESEIGDEKDEKNEKNRLKRKRSGDFDDFNESDEDDDNLDDKLFKKGGKKYGGSVKSGTSSKFSRGKSSIRSAGSKMSNMSKNSKMSHKSGKNGPKNENYGKFKQGRVVLKGIRRSLNAKTKTSSSVKSGHSSAQSSKSGKKYGRKEGFNFKR